MPEDFIEGVWKRSDKLAKGGPIYHVVEKDKPTDEDLKIPDRVRGLTSGELKELILKRSNGNKVD